jgi:predicted double-glycine peptidase
MNASFIFQVRFPAARLWLAAAVAVAGASVLDARSGCLQAGNVFLPTKIGGPANIEVVSIKEARFQTVIKQQYDFSCGSAALASLLSFHYDRPVTELEVFKAMYDVGDQQRIQAYGFSLLDMKRYLESIGLRSDGFRVDLERLERAGVPALVLINTHGYKHFVLIKGMSRDEVVVGDPALGVRVMPKEDFLKMWNGIAFVVRSDVSMGRRHFNLAQDWGVRKRAPFGSALSRQSLASFTTHLTQLTNSF